MKKFLEFRNLLMIALSFGFIALAAGSTETPSNPTETDSPNQALNIPEDDMATEEPVVQNPNAEIPNPNLVVLEQNGYPYLTITLTGIWDEVNSEWLELSGTTNSDQNVWVSIDDNPKGIDVYNNSSEDSKEIIADVVFLVDNSGSMDEEAEAVANSILAWSKMLQESGLNLSVGCVGYGDSYNAVDGAHNMGTAEELEQWMANNGYGTWRTHTFGGDDADQLSTLAKSEQYDNGAYNECGMVALHFAHDNFNFRGGSNRIYVNFTDEPNQPYGNEKWSVEYLNPENNNWKTNDGTIHTVFSEDKNYWDYYLSDLYYENPWIMSEYTGGTILYTDSYFTDFTLVNLPVTGAMQNSYIIRLTNIADLFDGQEHKITITVYSPDGEVQAVKVIYFVFG